MLYKNVHRLALPCKAKHVTRLAEEVCAGRQEVLDSLPTEDLELVLEAVRRKRANDIKYLAGATKRRKLREMPQLPSILHKPLYVHERQTLQDIQFANSCVAKGLHACNMKARAMFLFFETKSPQTAST